MKRLRDFTQCGSVAELRSNLKEMETKLLSAGAALWDRIDLELGCRVYPGIARATAEQLQLLEKHLEEPIEITASVCRMVFEINVVLRYCLSSKSRLDAFADQSVADEISIYKGIKGLADEDTNPKNLEIIDQKLNQLRTFMEARGRNPKPERPPVSQMAKDVGLKKEYEAMYGIYSKYVHASAWFIVRKRDHFDQPMYRMSMHLHTQLYAADTLGRLQELNK